MLFWHSHLPHTYFLCRYGCGNQKAGTALGLALVIWELLEQLRFRKSCEISLLVAVGEHFHLNILFFYNLGHSTSLYNSTQAQFHSICLHRFDLLTFTIEII